MNIDFHFRGKNIRAITEPQSFVFSVRPANRKPHHHDMRNAHREHLLAVDRQKMKLAERPLSFVMRLKLSVKNFAAVFRSAVLSQAYRKIEIHDAQERD